MGSNSGHNATLKMVSLKEPLLKIMKDWVSKRQRGLCGGDDGEEILVVKIDLPRRQE